MRLTGKSLSNLARAMSVGLILGTMPVAAGAQDASEIDAAFREVIGVGGIGAPRISPDGTRIAYSVSSVDWEANRYDSEIWIVGPGIEAYQLTRTDEGSSGSHTWHPSGRYLAFAASRSGSRQIHTIRPDGVENPAEVLVRLTTYGIGARREKL